MADDATKTTSGVDTKPEEISTRLNDAAAAVDTAPATGGEAAKGTDAQNKDEATLEKQPAANTTDPTDPVAEGDKPSDEPTNNGTVTTNGTAEDEKREKKRRSIAAALEARGKKLNRKKSLPDAHLNCQPGEYWWARTKGNPAWPCIICDEDMLPDSLLSKRPVSAARPDGTMRADFQDGGKNARDRRYPIMFLGTNEFAWQVNTELRPLELDEVKELIAKGPTGKMTRKLWEAYEVCMEQHELSHFKKMLDSHFEAAREEERKAAEAEAKKKEEAEAEAAAPKSAKRGKRKSVAPVEDVEMPDAEEDADAKKPKSAKGRKRKAPDTEGEEKAAKTPKMTMKLKGLNTPKEPQEESTKKSAGKTKIKKPSKSSDEESNKAEDKPPLSEAELKEKTRKTVLYLRHRLQKGFLTRDSEPKEEEMADMADHFKSLEEYKGLEPEIIKGTKIHKVLKAIIRLGSIPKDEEYGFKKRSNELLVHWNKALAADTSTGGADGDEAKTNGVSHEDEPATSKSSGIKDEEMKDEATDNAAEAEAAVGSKEQPVAETVESAAA